MKVMYITVYPPLVAKHAKKSGVAWYMKTLIEKIPFTNSDKVYILCDKLNGKFEKCESDKINIIRCFDRKPRFIFQILRYVKKIKPDVIHVQQEIGLYGNIFTAYLLQWLLFLLKNYYVVITIHGIVSLKDINKSFLKINNIVYPVWLSKLAFYIIFTPLCTWAKKIIVHENYFKKLLVNEYKVREEKIVINPIGVENLETLTKLKACEHLELDPQKNICLFMGYAAGYKGIDLLLEGFSIYAKKNPNAYLILGAGKHPRYSNQKKYLLKYRSWQEKSKRIINPNQFRWVGFILEDEIKIYFSASDVCIFPYMFSISSSGPMTLALGYKRPFLASDVFSYLFEEDDLMFEKKPDSLAMKLQEFFSSKEKFIENIEKYREKRKLDLIANKTYQLYKKMV